MKKLRVTVEGKTYEVLVEVLDEPSTNAAPTPRPAHAADRARAPAAAAPSPGSAPAAAPVAATATAGDIVSPLAGRVVSIDVQVGQPVEVGSQVATVEAMKMNTYIHATAAGTVGTILAKAGDSVEEGAPLLRLA